MIDLLYDNTVPKSCKNSVAKLSLLDDHTYLQYVWTVAEKIKLIILYDVYAWSYSFL